MPVFFRTHARFGFEEIAETLGEIKSSGVGNAAYAIIWIQQAGFGSLNQEEVDMLQGGFSGFLFEQIA